MATGAPKIGLLSNPEHAMRVYQGRTRPARPPRLCPLVCQIKKGEPKPPPTGCQRWIPLDEFRVTGTVGAQPQPVYGPEAQDAVRQMAAFKVAERQTAPVQIRPCRTSRRSVPSHGRINRDAKCRSAPAAN